MIDNRSVVLSREPEASPSPTGKEETQEAEYRRLAEVTVQLQALYQATTAIHSSLDLPKIFTQITDGLVKLMGYNTALIMMLDDEEGRFQLKAVSTRRRLLPQINKVLGFPLKNLSFSREEARQSSALRSVLEGRVAVAKTLAEVAHPIINRNVCSILQQMAGTKTYLVLPLQVGGEVIGGILTTTSREEIAEEELKLLEGFSEAAAQAIKNARLVEQLRQTERELREGEARYRTIVETALEGICITDPEEKITFVNRGFAQMLGFSAEELIGQTVQMLVSEEDWKKVRQETKKRRRGETSRYELTLLGKGAIARSVIVSAAPLFGMDGEYLGSIGIFTDITERKQVEEKSRLQQAYFQQLFEASPDAIALLDEADRVVNVNRAFEELFGYQIEEIKGRGINELIVPEDRHEEASHLSQLSLQGRAVRKETVRKRKDGRLVDVSIVGYPVRFDNQTVGVYAIYRDITERKQAEEALRRSEEKYRTLVENADIGICRVTPGAEGRHLEVNPAMSRMLGYSREELLEKSIAEMYLDPADRKRVSDEICARGSFKGEINLRRKDGTPIVVYLTGTAVRNEKGEVKYIDTILEDITERKQAQEELQRRQEQLQRILDSSGESIVFIDLKGIIIETNQRTAEMFGYTSREELRGKNALELIAPRDHERIKANMARVVKQGITLRNVEYAGHRVDGSEFPIELSTAVLRDASGKPIGHVSIASDITERKKAEEALRESEEKFRTFTESAPVAMMIYQDYRCVYANAAAERITGYSAEELSSLRFWDFLHPDFRRMAIEGGKAMERGEEPPKRSEFRIITKNGEERWLDCRSEVIKYQGKRAVLISAMDITERKQAEQALRESEERYRVTFETTGTALTIVEEDTTLSLVNSQFEELSGYSKEEIEGKKSWTEFVLKDDLERMKEYHRLRRIREDLAPSSYEFRFVDRYGQVKDILMTIAMIPGTKKSIASLLDITERKQAERREKELQRELNLSSRLAAVGELASGVAHEINNPLTAVIGFSELLMSRDVPPEIKQDLRIINENAQRVARIVKNLLTFARQSKPGREYVDINSLVTQVLELRAYQMQNNNIEVSTQLAPELPRTMADPGQLQQVFLNIVINAEQAMRETRNKRRLLVKTERVGNFIRVSFKDSGPGIPPENLDKIFDPFFTTKEVGEGTGLGLSISYGVIKEHGGRIYAKSKPGQGATFVVELPIVAEAEQAELVEPSEKEPGKVTGAKIMVVDDEAGVRQFLSRALTQEGHKVETINDAKIALERLKRERYHLILLDIKMPGMDGFDFYRQIGKIAPSLQRRTVFITGDTLTPNTWDFLNRTKARYISKPFKLEQLKRDINRILSENGAGGP